MQIAVTGSSGLIGTALTRSLRADGHRVISVVRRPPAPGEDAIRWDPAAGTIDSAALEDIDAVVHLAGAGIGDHRWSAAYKHELIASRTNGTSLMANTLAALDRPAKVLVSASATGFYGKRGDEVVDETSTRGDGFLADLCVGWEAAARPAVDAGIRTVFIRTGAVASADGGMLVEMLPLFRLGLGGPMGSGRQWWSWISIIDEVRAIRFLIDHELEGPVNLTAPEPVTSKGFAKTLGKVLRRPARLPIPAFAPRILRGTELANELLFTSQRVRPAALTEAGFSFAHPDLESALRDLLNRPDAHRE